MATQVSHDTGEEGPKYDPYHYYEIEVTRNGHTYLGHFGLAEWVKVDGNTVEPKDGENHDQLFQRLTGAFPSDWLKWLAKSEARCRHCHNKKKFHHASGYPGETLTICSNCDHIVHSHVNWSAIE